MTSGQEQQLKSALLSALNAQKQEVITDGQTDGWMDGWIEDGWTDRRMDGWKISPF